MINKETLDYLKDNMGNLNQETISKLLLQVIVDLSKNQTNLEEKIFSLEKNLNTYKTSLHNERVLNGKF